MRMRRVATAALIALLACTQVQARTLDQVPPYLKKEGNFVAYPAIAVGALGMLVGSVIALPASLVAAPIGWAAGDPLGYALVPMSLVATGGTEVGYHVGGAVPWLLKNSFYDAPMTAIARIKGEPASGLVAQVEPPPITPADIQYLDSTPPDARVPVMVARQYSSALPPPKEPTSLMLRRQLSPFKAPPLPGSRPAIAKPAPVAPVAIPAPASSFADLPAKPAAATVPPVAVAAPPPAVLPPPVSLPVTVPVPPPPVVVAPPPPPPVVVVPPVAEVQPVAPPESRLPDQPERASVEVPVTDAAAEPGADEYLERPAIKKKKRKFSERFSF